MRRVLATLALLSLAGCVLDADARPGRDRGRGGGEFISSGTPVPQLGADTEDSGNAILSNGQSLSIGGSAGGVLTTSQPFSNVRMYAGGTWPALVEATVETHVSASLNHLRNAAGAARNWIGDTYGGGGTDIEGFHIAGAPLFEALLTDVGVGYAQRAGVGGTFRVVGIDYIQGEQDVTDGTAGSAYTGFLEAMADSYQTRIRAATGQTHAVPIFVSQLSSATAVSSGSANAAIADAQFDAQTDRPNQIFLVGPKYHMTYVDGVHLNAANYRLMGEYFGMVHDAVLIDGVAWRGLVPTSITASGTTISVCYSVPCNLMGTCGATQLAIDTSLVACPWTTSGGANCLNGYELTDTSPNPARLVSAAVSGATNCVDLTTDVAVHTGATLSYAYTGVVGALAGTGGTTSAGSQRGNLRDTNTITGYHSSTTLYNWAAHHGPIAITGGAATETSVAALLDDRRPNWLWSGDGCPSAGAAWTGTVNGSPLALPYVRGTWTCDTATPGTLAASTFGTARDDNEIDGAAEGNLNNGCWSSSGAGTSTWNIAADEDFHYRYVGELSWYGTNSRLIHFLGDVSANNEFYVQIGTTGTITLYFQSGGADLNLTYTVAEGNGLTGASTPVRGILDIHIQKRGGNSAADGGEAHICWNGNCERSTIATAVGATGTGNLAIGGATPGTCNATLPWNKLAHAVWIGERARAWWSGETTHDADVVTCQAAGYCP